MQQSLLIACNYSKFCWDICICNSFCEVALSLIQKAPSALIAKDIRKSMAAEEESESRNIMGFGLTDDENQQIYGRIEGLVWSSNIRVRNRNRKLEACRLERKWSSLSRPIKFMLSSSTFVQKILSRSMNLRQSENFKAIIWPLTIKHNELVAQLKEK